MSGGRFNPFTEKANAVMSKIEGVGNMLTNGEGPLRQGLGTISRKLNA